MRLAPIGLGVVLLGATCVTRFDRHGELGPWTGEFVNYNQYRASQFETSGSVTDANGVDAGPIIASICPTELEPGEIGAFETRLFPPAPGLALPLTASPPAIAAYSGLILEQLQPGLATRVVSMDGATSTAVVDLRNTTTNEAYPSGRVCGVARDSAGAIVSVSPPVSVSNLDPGQASTYTLAFATLAGATTIDVHARTSLARILETAPSGARRFHAGSFLVTLPRGWHYYPLQGSDSLVGRLGSDDGAELFFDYGAYSSDLSIYETSAKYTVLHEKIDGFDATIVYPRSGDAGVVGLSIVTYDPASGGLGLSLLMTGEDLTPKQRVEALAIFRSIDFVAK